MDDDLPEERGLGAPAALSDADYRDAKNLFGPGDFHNVEAEAALLGALMIDNRLVGDVSQNLAEEHFFEPVHGRIYRAIVRVVGNGKTATPVTLRPIFEHDSDIGTLGGPAYLAQLTGSGAAIIGARDFADQVCELARMRRIYDAMIATARAFQDTGEVAGSIDNLEQEIWKAADVRRPIKIHTAGGMFRLTQDRIQRISENPGGTVGSQSRTLPEITALVGGLEGGQGTIIAGRPGSGKTTTAISFSWGCAANGHPILYCHAEMSDELMALKVATDICYSLGTPIEFKRVRKGQLTMAEQRSFDEAREKADLLPIRFAATGRTDTTRLEAVIARECAYWEAKGQPLEAVVLDHIGLFQVTGIRNDDPRARVSAMSKWSMDISGKYGIHVIALCQLSRKVEDRTATDRRPQLADLRDSGNLEEDFDNVLFAYRPEMYLADEKPKPGAKNYEAAIKDWEIDMAEWKNKMEIIVGKARLDSRGSRRVQFHGDYSAARSLSYRSAEDQEGEDLFMAGGPA